jgi:hypothetical protein
MPERRRRPAAALRAGLLLAALLVTGCYGVDYRFLAVGGGGTPVAQRCGSMPFRINPHGADAEWQLVAVVRAVQRLEATTGVDWRFDGYTGERIATGFDPRLDGGRVLIEFTSFDAPGTPSAYGHPKPSGVGDRYLGGYVYLWPSRIRGLSSTQLRALVEHELGHVWGLDHPSAPPEQELMNAAPLRRADYGYGDLAGLRTLTASCRQGG